MGCIPVILSATEDFSDFEEFQFTSSGVCPSPELVEPVRRASIVRTGDDRYELDMTIVEEGAEGIDDCDPNFASAGCFVARDLPVRELTADEVEGMQAVFSTVTVETVLYFPLCAMYCETRLARWDSVEVTGAKSCTGGIPYRALSYEQMDEIVAFLESLVHAAE